MEAVVDMAEAHAWTLQRLREMAGRLTEQAYLKACAAGRDDETTLPDPDAQARWMLIFDRMARGLRLTMALEARLARERRADAGQTAETVSRPGRPASTRDVDDEPRERDRESDDDGLPDDAALPERIARIQAIVEGAADAAPVTLRFRFEDPLPLDGGAGAGVGPLRPGPAALDPAPPPPSPTLLPSRGKRAPPPAWRGSG